MMNLSSAIEHSATEYPDKIAIIFNDSRLSYGTINSIANQVANSLIKVGIGKGDKVALTCPNLPYFPMIYYGILKTGAVVVPLNILLKGREIAYHLTNSDAKAYFCFQGTPELPMAEEGFAGFELSPSCEHFWVMTSDPAAPSPIAETSTFAQLISEESSEFNTMMCAPDDTSVIMYTSGTTGQPKGAELSHANIVMNSKVCSELFNLKHDDVQLIALPLFHTYGQTTQMNAGFSKGNTTVMVPRFVPERVLALMEKERVSVFHGVPTMYFALLSYEDKEGKINVGQIADTLRVCGSGGASIPVQIMKEFEEKYKVPILEGYGLSETSPAATFNHQHKERKPGSIGTPIWGVEVRVVNSEGKEVVVGEVGEVLIRGHNVMKGYYNNPEQTASAINSSGWFHTGDMGKMDDDGYFYIVDRIKDLIIRGGYNVYPREIEEVLLRHPAVSIIAVIGVPHDQYGQEIKAFVVLKEGENASEEELIQWSKKEMAGYKYPRIFEIRENLLMTATGKILKKELMEEVAAN